MAISSYSQQISEYELKANYLLSFQKYVAPISDTKHVIIGIYGKDPFDFILEQIIDVRRSKDKSIEWSIEHYSSLKNIDNCNILFISGVNNAELIKVLKTVKGLPILTVGDQLPGFCDLGGMINFTAQGSSKRFEVNNKVAKESQLIISSKLLTLSKIIAN